MEVTYSNGPRYIDGVNIDADVNAAFAVEDERQISDPVTNYKGHGYAPGQKNLDGSEM